MNELPLLGETENIFVILSYIITVVIGGVVYKFWKLWINTSSDKIADERQGYQMLVTALQNRVDKISERVTELETERKEIHIREVQSAKDLERAKAEVRILQEKVRYLEENTELFKSIIQRYREKFGKIEDD
jgi:predicted negative regulator of RcsB-dependent stress response